MVDILLVLLVDILLVHLPLVDILLVHLPLVAVLQKLPSAVCCLCLLWACGCPCILSHLLVVLPLEASSHMLLAGLHKLVVLRMLVLVDMSEVVHMLVVVHIFARLVGLLLWLVPLLQIVASLPVVLSSQS